MEKIFNDPGTDLPMPGCEIFIRMKEEAVLGQDYPRGYVVTVRVSDAGEMYFVEASGEQYAEFDLSNIKDWCYLSALMNLE